MLKIREGENTVMTHSKKITLLEHYITVNREAHYRLAYSYVKNKENALFQESVKRAANDGHYIGGHSMTHDFNVLYKQQQFVPEMKETLALIHEITGTAPILVRPPYGSAPGLKNVEIRNQTVAAGIRVWDWTIDSNDWRLKGNPAQVIENIKQETNANTEVVLMHENEQTLAALPGIISFLKNKDTLSSCMMKISILV